MENSARQFLVICWFACLILLTTNTFSQTATQVKPTNSQEINSGKSKGNSGHDDKGGDKGDKNGHHDGDGCANNDHNKGDHKGDKGDKGDGNGGDHGSGKGGECDGNCFSTEVLSAVLNENGCVEYEIQVSHGPECRYELSHLTVEVPCGTIHELSNDRGWKLEYGTDPTTGLSGFKIDDISDFGKGSDTTFIVKVTICGDDTCPGLLGQVAYKAGQCVDYETPEYVIDDGSNNGGGDTGGGDTGGGDTGGGDTGGGDTGGGDTGGGDTGGGDTGGGDTGGGDTGGGDTGGGGATCSSLIATIGKTDVTCYNAADGTLSVSVQAGVEPIEYHWSNGSTSSNLSGLTPGSYTVTIIDADGNTLTLSETVNSPTDIVISKSSLNPTCNGSANGSIDITVSGGAAPYTYSWNNGATTEDIANLPAGLLIVTVTDANGCKKQSTTLLQNSINITTTSTLTKPSSCAASDGAINVTVNNGTSPYTYLWSNGATTEDLSGIPAGNYSLTITDANGCKGTGNYTLVETNSLQTSFAVTPTACIDDNSGGIDITVTGGTPPYTYSWAHGPTTEDVSGLKASIYRVTVTDAAGCSQQTAINVPKKTIEVQDIITQPLCNGDSTGSITVNPSGGTSPYTYTWTTGGTSNSIDGLPEGTYQVTITDASGCSRTLQYSITQPLALTSSTSVSTTQCGADGSFSIDLSVTGGKAPYAYSWSSGQATQDITGISAGSYNVQITDNNGCTNSADALIDAAIYQTPCSIIQPIGPVACSSVGNSITSDVSGAQSYAWSVTSSDNSWSITAGAASSTAIFTSGTAGSEATFTLTVVIDGCTKTCSYSTGTEGCVVKDNDGGGDPNAGDPCTTASDSTSTADNSGSKVTEPADEETVISAYPNPFETEIKFEWKAPKTEYVKLEVYDAMGSKVRDVYAGKVDEGTTYSFSCSNLGSKNVYIYRLTGSTKTYYGKLLRK